MLVKEKYKQKMLTFMPNLDGQENIILTTAIVQFYYVRASASNYKQDPSITGSNICTAIFSYLFSPEEL